MEQNDKKIIWQPSPYTAQARHLAKMDTELQAAAMATEITKTNTRGGARQGSGRKAAATKKVTISFRVTEATHDKIQELREDGIDITGELEKLVARLTKRRDD